MGRVSYRPKYVVTEAQHFKPDPDEEAALAKALEAFNDTRSGDPERAVYTIISAWIMERTLRASAKCEAVGLSYDLDDSHLRGIATQMLPQIGTRIAACEIDGSVPFFEMSKDDAVTVLVEAFLYMQTASKMMEAAPFPENISAPKPDKRHIAHNPFPADLDDKIPF